MRIIDCSSDVCSSDLEALGVEIYPGFAASSVLHAEDGRVQGVRIGDMGVAKDGSHKPGFTKGIDLGARKIGRASCGEEGCQTVEISVLAVSINIIYQ